MSGGSYNYLYSRFETDDIAYDVRRMSQRLEDLVLRDTSMSSSTLEILRLAESLKDVWQAVEWADSRATERARMTYGKLPLSSCRSRRTAPSKTRRRAAMSTETDRAELAANLLLAGVSRGRHPAADHRGAVR